MTYSLELQAKRATVIRLSAIGMPGFFLLLVGLYAWMPPPRQTETSVDRLVLALRCDAIVALTLFAGIMAVSRLRRQSDAIDPLAGKDPPNLRVHTRYIQNTLEQVVLFAMGTAALSTYLDAGSARALPALAVAFIVARLVFWRGYFISPPARALGMAGTFLVNLLIYGAVLYFALSAGGT